MTEDEYVMVQENEMTLNIYPCGLQAGEYLAPQRDLYYADEAGEMQLYLKKGGRCLSLSGNPKEPDIIWFRICATGEVATWYNTILENFEIAPEKRELHAEDLLNKLIVVGITKCDENDNTLSRECRYGKIVAVSDNISIEDAEMSEIFTIPFYSDAIEEADPEINFTFDDFNFSGIDFISQWCVYDELPQGALQ